MNVAILARTRWGIAAAERLQAAGQRIAFVATHRSELFYECGVDEYRTFAARAGARFVDASAISSADLISEIPSDCAVAISVNWPSLLGRNVISKFPFGVLNVHAGDLPRYRGNACPNWAILNGEPYVGLCVHIMEPDALDSGPVLVRDQLPLSSNVYIDDVYRWLDRRIPDMLAAAALGLLNSSLAAVPQSSDPMLSLRCYPRKPEDGRICWRASAEYVHRLVRASGRPFAGAFSFLSGGRRITVWRAEIFQHRGAFCAVPGQVLMRDKGAPIVACGIGCLALTEVEIVGLDAAAARQAVAASLRSRLA